MNKNSKSSGHRDRDQLKVETILLKLSPLKKLFKMYYSTDYMGLYYVETTPCIVFITVYSEGHTQNNMMLSFTKDKDTVYPPLTE